MEGLIVAKGMGWGELVVVVVYKAMQQCHCCIRYAVCITAGREATSDCSVATDTASM